MNPPNAELLETLLDAHGRALVLYARQWCATPEDVIQEAFIKLARQKNMPRRPVAWLYRVARNGAITASRATRRRTRRETAVAQRGEPWFESHDDRRLDADEAARALGELPPCQREVIVARLWGGLSFNEIAQLVGSSSSTVGRHYQAGLSALRERLDAPCPDPKNPTTKN